MQDTWHIISGEYPPREGGVSDYTVALSAALAERGCSVHLWVRGFEMDSECITPNLTVHRCVGEFGRASLANLGKRLANFQGRRKILIQYVPHAYGFKAMNLGFAIWVRSRGRDHGDDVRIMFHEIAFPWVWWPIHHNLLAFVNRLMAWMLIQSASRLYGSTSSWNRILLSLGAEASKIRLLPIPSNVPQADAQEAAKMRASILGADSQGKLVGHFGTYGKWVGSLLLPILTELLRSRGDVHLLLIGDGSQEFRVRILTEFPNCARRVTATGRKELGEIASLISSCDLMVQPYRDGVNTRRGSLMACLINGKAVITNLGQNSESGWDEDQLKLSEVDDVAKFVGDINSLLDCERKISDLGVRGQNYYLGNFRLEKTVEILLCPNFETKEHCVNAR